MCVLGAGVGVGVPIKPEAPFLWMSKSASRPIKLHWESGAAGRLCVTAPNGQRIAKTVADQQTRHLEPMPTDSETPILVHSCNTHICDPRQKLFEPKVHRAGRVRGV